MYYLFIILNKLQINYWFSGQKFFLKNKWCVSHLLKMHPGHWEESFQREALAFSRYTSAYFFVN